MKAYPSISSSNGTAFREFKADVFDKLDGSNLRFEWSKKQGWVDKVIARYSKDEAERIICS